MHIMAGSVRICFLEEICWNWEVEEDTGENLGGKYPETRMLWLIQGQKKCQKNPTKKTKKKVDAKNDIKLQVCATKPLKSIKHIQKHRQRWLDLLQEARNWFLLHMGALRRWRPAGGKR